MQTNPKYQIGHYFCSEPKAATSKTFTFFFHLVNVYQGIWVFQTQVVTCAKAQKHKRTQYNGLLQYYK